jgi:hypothetical protein
MNTQPNDGGPAFPMMAHDSSIGEQSRPIYGMTLCDYFAGKAMEGIIKSAMAFNAPKSSIAIDAYEIADAMIAARERKEGDQ